MLTIYLTPSEERHVTAAAAAVNANKERVGLPNVGWTKNGLEQAPLQQRVDAFRAEYAVNKALGLPPLDWELHDGGDGGTDIILPFPFHPGKNIQVKHRTSRNRDLATSSLDHHRELKGADLFVLTWPAADQTGIDIIGWCYQTDFLRRIMDLNRPPVKFLGLRYEMKWDSDLRPIEELISEVARARRSDQSTHRNLVTHEGWEDDTSDGAVPASRVAG